jgi:class 3 adenylate cyclase/tetratricopeptide (TPR) repeat protein
MRCPHCDFQNVVDSVVCGQCGAAIRQTYTPPHLTAGVLASSAVEGERKQVTVLFCDLVGSTGLAERLGAEKMHALLDAFFAIAMTQVHRYEGTVNQFLGDGFMALFGAPAAHEDHARRAALAAVGIHGEIERRQMALRGSAHEPIAVRMGLNSGTVVVGRIGDNLRFDYTAVGDTTNLAARMQQLAQPGAVYLTAATRRLIDPYVETVGLGERHLKGKHQPVHVYQITGLRSKVEAGPAAREAVHSPLVGRDDELNRLTQSLDRLRHGEGAVVAVLGEAGLGKSRLIAEVGMASGRDVRWLEGRGLSFGSSFSYWPFLEVLRGAATIGGDDNEAEAAAKLEALVGGLFPDDIADILPYLAALLSLPITPELQHRVTYLDGQAMGSQVFRSVLLLVERMARKQPLVLVFEDIHWADRSSLDLLEHIAPLVASVPLLLVVVGRPEQDTSAARFYATAREGAANRYVEIALGPLSESSSHALLDNLLAGDERTTRLKQVAIRRAEGNPFFLEEIIRAVVANHILEWHAAGQRWKVAREIEQIGLPDTLHDVIAARIDRLDPEVKQLLKVASVIGRSFYTRVLQAASGVGDELDTMLGALQTLELIGEKRHVPEPEYVFKHALVQEATYATLLTSRRRELHLRVGECIEQLFTDRLEDFYSVLAYHYARAEAWDKAQAYLFKAGDRAGRIAADAEALMHYRHAIEAYERAFGDTWNPLQRSTLERKMGEALFRLGQHEQALAIVIAAKARLHRPLTALPKSGLGIRLAIGLEIARRAGRSVVSRVAARRTPASVDPGVLDEIARLGEVTGWIDYFLNPERFLLQALTGLSYFERHPYAIGLIYNHMSIGLICDVIPAFRLAEHHHQRAVAIATENGQPIALGHAHLGMGIHAHSMGRLEVALQKYETAATIFKDIGHIRGWGGATMLRAWAYEDLGDFTRALSYADSVSEIGDESSDPQVRAWGLLRRGVSKRHIGRADEAVGDLEVSVALSKQIPDYAGVVQGLAVLALCHLDRHDRPEARRLIDEANRIRVERQLRGMWVTYAVTGAADVGLAEFDGADGGLRRDRLRAAGRACRDVQRQTPSASHRQSAALRLMGHLHWREGKRAAAERDWQRSIDAARGAGTRYQLALARADIGRHFNRRDELERAAVLFREAGAIPDVARVERLLGTPSRDDVATS